MRLRRVALAAVCALASAVAGAGSPLEPGPAAARPRFDAQAVAPPRLHAQAAAPARLHAQAATQVTYTPPVRGPIIRRFEPPPTPYAAGHRGIDIAAGRGSNVVASAAGRVAFAGQVGGELFVSIDHADGLRTTYSFLDAVLVRAGEQVAARQPVARSGAGHAGSSQPHLHFGLRRGSEYLDPEPYLAAGIRRNYAGYVRLVPPPPE